MSRNNNRIIMPGYGDVKSLIEELGTDPHGIKPNVGPAQTKFSEDPTGARIQYWSIPFDLPQVGGALGIVKETSQMLMPQDYVFTEVTMGMRDVVNYMRAYADLIESKLPEVEVPDAQ